MSFWTKTRRQIEFYCPENFEILCHDLSKISKNPKNDLFFTHLVRTNGFEKNQNFKFKSIILHTNYEKKVNFVKFFREKFDFCQILFQFFHFVLNKACFFEYGEDFIFQILPIFQGQKIKFFFLWGKKLLFSVLFQKKDFFVSICLTCPRRKTFQLKNKICRKIFIKKLNHPLCPDRDSSIQNWAYNIQIGSPEKKISMFYF